MPKHTFKCSGCSFSQQEIVPVSTVTIPCPLCGTAAERQLPTLNGPSNITEVVNKLTGVAIRADQKEEVKQRREEYYWSVEVPRFVASGVYAIDTMMENEWIWVDDNNHIHAHTKPPNKR